MSEQHVYVNPDAEWQYPGDIRRIIPDWEIGDELPEGWHEVTNPSQPEPIFIYPEFGEGEDETNTAPIKQIMDHTTIIHLGYVPLKSFLLIFTYV